jgi:TrmH family RNA methyltransferase
VPSSASFADSPRPAGTPAGRSAVGPDDVITDGVVGERSSRIAGAHRLLRRSRRTEVGQFLAEGAQAVQEALTYARENPGRVHELYVTREAAERHVGLVRQAYGANVEVTVVTDKAMGLLTDTATPQGLVVRADTIDVPLAEALGANPRLVAVLVDVNDPGNAGTVVRLADAAGADAVIFAGNSVDPFNAKAVRASTGSVFHLPVSLASVVDVLAALSQSGLSALATSGSADVELPVAGAEGLLDLPTAWLFGSEAHGLPSEVVSAADETIRVPIYGKAESLNLATAAALCLYASASAHRANAKEQQHEQV